MKGFTVTYETVTYESAENGDCEDSGFLLENGTLRDALDLVARQAEGGYEWSDYPNPRPGAWITAYKTDYDMRTGAVENRSIHFPLGVTQSSMIRIGRLIGANK